MSLEEVKTICQWMISLGIKKIRFTGGEPLLYKHIEQLLEFTTRFGIETALTTNGILLKKYLKTIIGLKIKVNISLDTLNKEKFYYIAGVDCFEELWDTILHFVTHNYPIKINVVVMRGINDNEIIDFVKLTKDLSLHVRFIEFMPFNGNKWNWKYCITGKEILDVITQHFDIEKLNDDAHSVARSYRVPSFKGTFAVITSVSEPFCITCNRLRINYRGKLLYCLFDDIGIDLLPFVKQDDFEGFKNAVEEYVRKKPLMRAGKELNSHITSFAMTELGG